MFTNYSWPKAFDNFLLSLRVMGFGMLSIFIVILILLCAVYLLIKITDRKPGQSKDNN